MSDWVIQLGREDSDITLLEAHLPKRVRGSGRRSVGLRPTLHPLIAESVHAHSFHSTTEQVLTQRVRANRLKTPGWLADDAFLPTRQSCSKPGAIHSPLSHAG